MFSFGKIIFATSKQIRRVAYRSLTRAAQLPSRAREGAVTNLITFAALCLFGSGLSGLGSGNGSVGAQQASYFYIAVGSLLRVGIRADLRLRYQKARNLAIFDVQETSGSRPGSGGSAPGRSSNRPAPARAQIGLAPHPRHTGSRYCCSGSLVRSCYGSTRGRSVDCCSKTRPAKHLRPRSAAISVNPSNRCLRSDSPQSAPDATPWRCKHPLRPRPRSTLTRARIPCTLLASSASSRSCYHRRRYSKLRYTVILEQEADGGYMSQPCRRSQVAYRKGIRATRSCAAFAKRRTFTSKTVSPRATRSRAKQDESILSWKPAFTSETPQ